MRNPESALMNALLVALALGIGMGAAACALLEDLI